MAIELAYRRSTPGSREVTGLRTGAGRVNLESGLHAVLISNGPCAIFLNRNEGERPLTVALARLSTATSRLSAGSRSVRIGAPR